MRTALRYGAQALLYAAFVAVIGYFSTSPSYEHLAPGDALLKVSLTHAGARKQACRERVPVTVEVTLDGAPLFRVVAPPSGLSKDGASTIYRRVPIAAGKHRIGAWLADGPTGEFTFTSDTTIELAPGRVVVIDFDPQHGGLVFRG